MTAQDTCNIATPQEARHNGFCISGTMTIRPDDGSEFTVEPRDVVLIDPRARRVDHGGRGLRPARHGRRGLRPAR